MCMYVKDDWGVGADALEVREEEGKTAWGVGWVDGVGGVEVQLDSVTWRAWGES